MINQINQMQGYYSTQNILCQIGSFLSLINEIVLTGFHTFAYVFINTHSHILLWISLIVNVCVHVSGHLAIHCFVWVPMDVFDTNTNIE